MTIPDHAAVLAALASSPDRAVRIGGYWAKRAAKAEMNAWHDLQHFLYRTLRIKLFQPTGADDPVAALAGEAERLDHLRRHGFRTPEVARLTPEYVLLSDAGREVNEVMRSADASTRTALVRQCAVMLARLHRAGLWHGRASLRDFVLDAQNELGFIDCEEDASGLGSWAQPRDVMLFCQSVAKFSEDGSLLQEALAAYDCAPVKSKLTTALRLMSPLAWILRPFREKLGRDLRQMVDVCAAVKS